MTRVVYAILTYGREALRRKARSVAGVTDELRTLVRDMLATMYAARGVGLAAEQIGREEAVCVIHVPPESEKPECVAINAVVSMPLVMFNPVITASTGHQRNEEGCLSFPDINAPITRAAQVTVAYLDLEGQNQTATAQGLLARAIQHEIDHLNGVLLVDRMSTAQRLAAAGKLRRLKRQVEDETEAA